MFTLVDAAKIVPEWSYGFISLQSGRVLAAPGNHFS